MQLDVRTLPFFQLLPSLYFYGHSFGCSYLRSAAPKGPALLIMMSSIKGLGHRVWGLLGSPCESMGTVESPLC